ncbi:MAG TPA: HEAT repeat domain-containing protein [Gemmatimonadaceae bacterium]|nr:HEAT repeat domain-containing protein [Gemmatimonadaceae bacterium]
MRALVYLLLAAAVAAPRLGAQSLAERVRAVRDGTVQIVYASRPDACGDGNDVIALGRLVTVYPSIRGHGWSNVNCRFGPAHSLVTVRDGEVTAVRTFVGAPRRARPIRDLGTVPAADAADFFLGLASTGTSRVASWSVMAAALADSADIWRRLLALAREDDRPSDVRSSALYWLSGVAPAEAVGPLAAIARSGTEPRSAREGVLTALSQLRDAAGVPTLIALARGDEAAWLRERAIFWLGNTDDERARTTLRALASSDTLATNLRDQAIFALGFLDKQGSNGPFLRELYGRLESNRLKDKVIHAVAQLDEREDQRWLDRLVLDTSQSIGLRKQALFWRGQKQDAPLGELVELYPRLDSRELREHYVFVLSQRRESAAVDRLIDIARNDTDRAIRAKATFWLGQSRDPRAARYLEERINR